MSVEASVCIPVSTSLCLSVYVMSNSLGALAMEALHRQVLPFLLRRMKEDVLQDLPPKIIQDYHCDLSPLQVHILCTRYWELLLFDEKEIRESKF